MQTPSLLSPHAAGGWRVAAGGSHAAGCPCLAMLKLREQLGGWLRKQVAALHSEQHQLARIPWCISVYKFAGDVGQRKR